MFSLLTSPIVFFAAVMFTWVLLFGLLTRVFDLSPRAWKFLDFLWIFIGLLGVTSVLEQNRRDSDGVQQDNLKRRIVNGTDQVKSDLRIYFDCKPYIRSEYSPQDFEERKADQEILCRWASAYPLALDSASKLPVKRLSRIDGVKLGLRTDQFSEAVKMFNKNIIRINADLDSYDELSGRLKDHFWQDFQRSLGLLFILFAFGLRLAIATKNYFDAKPKEKLIIKEPEFEEVAEDTDKQ